MALPRISRPPKYLPLSPLQCSWLAREQWQLGWRWSVTFSQLVFPVTDSRGIPNMQRSSTDQVSILVVPPFLWCGSNRSECFWPTFRPYISMNDKIDGICPGYCDGFGWKILAWKRGIRVGGVGGVKWSPPWAHQRRDLPGTLMCDEVSTLFRWTSVFDTCLLTGRWTHWFVSGAKAYWVCLVLSSFCGE